MSLAYCDVIMAVISINSSNFNVMNTQGKHIVFFDGDCLVCNRFVQFLLKLDTKDHFLFSSLQSSLAKNILADIPNRIDSIVYVAPKGTYVKSEAVLNICKQLGFPYILLYLLKTLPIRWRDVLYDYFAKNRYRWFGRNQYCTILNQQQRKKFI